MMTTWEYKSIKFETKGAFIGGVIDIDELNKQANILGSQGWELVSTPVSSTFLGPSREIAAIFKRPKKIQHNQSIDLTAFRRTSFQPLDTRTKKKTGIESQGKSVDRSVQKLAFQKSVQSIGTKYISVESI